MKVSKLIDELKGLNPEWEVWIEGCDCAGKASYVRADNSDSTIMIMRED